MIKKNAILFMSVCLFGLSQSAMANATLLKQYTDLDTSLQNGHIVRAVVDFSKCSIETNVKQTMLNPVGGISFTEFLKYHVDVNGKTTNVIATTDTILVNSGKHGLVYDRLSLHAMDNGTVEFVSELVDPKNYNQVGETTYTCQFSGTDATTDGVKFFEIS